MTESQMKLVESTNSEGHLRMFLKVLIFTAIANLCLGCQTTQELHLSNDEPFVPEESAMLTSSVSIEKHNAQGDRFVIHRNVFSDGTHWESLVSVSLGASHTQTILVLDELDEIFPAPFSEQLPNAQVSVSRFDGSCQQGTLRGLATHNGGTSESVCLLLSVAN
jgi:hypothetical protein